MAAGAAMALAKLALNAANQAAIKSDPRALSALAKLLGSSATTAVRQAAKRALQILKSAPVVVRSLQSGKADKLANELIAEEEKGKTAKNIDANSKAAKKKASKIAAKAAASATTPAEAGPSHQAGPSQQPVPSQRAGPLQQAGPSQQAGPASGGGVVPANEDDDGSLLFSVCMEAPLSIMLAPCGHVELCHKCFESIQAVDNLVRYACMALLPCIHHVFSSDHHLDPICCPP